MSSGGITAILIMFVIVGGITAMVVAYLRLQRHRADAVAMAAYRKLAEEAVGKQAEVLAEMKELHARMAAIEAMMREVG